MLFVKGGSILSSTLAATTNTIIDCTAFDRFAIQVNYTNATTTGKTFTVASQVTDTLTVANHGWSTGLKGQASNAGGALPTGISALTDYFVIVVDTNTIALATSLANAVAGTKIDISSAGTGTQTFTPTTSTGNVLKAQASLEDSGTTNFVDVTTTNFPWLFNATVTIATSAGSALWDFRDSNFRRVNLLYTPSAGQIALSGFVYAKAYYN